MQQDIEVTLIGMNEIAREGLGRILVSENFNVRSSICDVNAVSCNAMSDASAEASQIIIVDRGANGEGLGLCKQLAHDYPGSRILLLADGYEYNEMATAFRFGVNGYLIKEISCEPLIESLRLIALGEKVMPSQYSDSLRNQVAGTVTGDWEANAQSVNLSDREIEMLACLSMGMANKVISRRHEISEATVKVHVKAILRKLRVANRTQAAIWAVQHGLNLEQLLGDAEVDWGEDECDLTIQHPAFMPAAGLISMRAVT